MLKTTMTYSNYFPANELLSKGVQASTMKVYVALHSHTKTEDVECFPSQQLLANETGFSVRTVNAALRELHNLGIIEKIRKGLNQVNHYILLAKKKIMEANEVTQRIGSKVQDIIRNKKQDKNGNKVQGEDKQYKTTKSKYIQPQKTNYDTNKLEQFLLGRSTYTPDIIKG